MMKKISFIVVTLISFLICSNIAEAQCSSAELYQEKLNASEIKVDYQEVEKLKYDENMSPPDYYEYYLYVRLFNVPDDVKVVVKSLNNSFLDFELTSKNKDEDGILYIKDDSLTNEYYNQIKRYQFEFISTSNTCYGELVGSTTLQTPMFNKYSLDNICDVDSDFKYCSRYLNYDITNLTQKDVSKAYNKYLEDKKASENSKEENKILKVASKYWFILIIIPVVIIIGYIAYIIIKKKRSKIV